MAVPLSRALVDKISNYRARGLVFRTRELGLCELEADLVAFANRLVADGRPQLDNKLAIRRDEERIVVSLPEGGRVIAFKASGALLGKRHLGPLEQPITHVQDAPAFEQQARYATRALGLDALTDARERLVF